MTNLGVQFKRLSYISRVNSKLMQCWKLHEKLNMPKAHYVQTVGYWCKLQTACSVAQETVTALTNKEWERL